MRWAGKEKVQAALERRGDISEGDKRPSLVGIFGIVQAFHELSTERQSGMSVGAIPVTRIAHYRMIHQLPEWLDWVIMAMDRVYLEAASDGK